MRRATGHPSHALLAALTEPRGKPLACWCRHEGEGRTEANACHADVLVELLEEWDDRTFRYMAREAGRAAERERNR